MPDIFISYSSKNKARVETLANALKNEGFDVWWDTHLAPGEKFRAVIQEQLEQAKSVLVVWTKQSIDSDWVKQEASKAHDRGVLIPVLFDSVVPPMPFGELQNADLRQWRGNIQSPEFQSLINTLKQDETIAATESSFTGSLRHWFKFHWKQFSLGAAFFGLLALIGGYNDIMQLWKGFSNNGFDTVKLDCSLATAQASSKAAPIFTAKLDRKDYKIGQALTIELTPDKDAYFTIIDHGSDPSTPERKHVLFNNEYTQKDVNFLLPKPNDGLMQVSGPTGMNVFEVIASLSPIKDPAAISKNVTFRKFAKDKSQPILETNNCTLSFKITN